jgi:hypothetical protein
MSDMTEQATEYQNTTDLPQPGTRTTTNPRLDPDYADSQVDNETSSNRDAAKWRKRFREQGDQTLGERLETMQRQHVANITEAAGVQARRIPCPHRPSWSSMCLGSYKE